MTWPSPRRRSFRALPFITVFSRLTWPSAASTTSPAAPQPPWRRAVPGAGIIGLRRALRPGVCPIVHAHQVLETHVGVALGGRDRGMPQELLDAAQVRARVEEMGGERVPQRVGMHA